MIDRSVEKKQALSCLKNNWTNPVLITIIYTVLNLLFNFKQFLSNFIKVETSTPPLITILWTLISFIIGFAAEYFYVHFVQKKEESTFNWYLDGLGLWVKALLINVYLFIKIFLWALLLIIPGIIKAISYSMAIRIVAEYPSISVIKAVKLSCLLTKGHLFDIFVFHLSFLGWFFLVALTGGIAGLWVGPYHSSATTSLYFTLKNNALESGIITNESFTE